MTTEEFTKIVQKIIENGRALNNIELENEFEFEAMEQGYGYEEIQSALRSDWFPWFKED